MEELPAGLYQVLLTEGLKERLGALAEALPTQQRALRAAETPDREASGPRPSMAGFDGGH